MTSDFLLVRLIMTHEKDVDRQFATTDPTQ